MEDEELSYQEVEELLEGVANNQKLVEIESREGAKFIILSYPPSQEILRSRYIRAKALMEAEKEGLPSREDIDKVIKERNFLGPEAKEKIEELERKIRAQEKILLLTKIPGRKKPIEETLQRFNNEINELKAKSEQLYVHTREFRADEESLLFLAWASTYKVTGERYWETFQDFEDEKDLFLRTSIVGAFAIFNRGSSVANIRLLARHVLWRIRYTAGLKIGGPLFPRGLYDMTPDQQSLLYWSNYYNSIYEMLPDDQPDEDTIKDDTALDAYMESYFKQREADRNDGRLKRRSGGKNLNTSGAQEVLITANHPEYLTTVYSESRVSAPEGEAEVEVISPSSKRSMNRRAIRKDNLRQR